MQKPQGHAALFCPPDMCFLPSVACDAQETQPAAAGGFARVAIVCRQGNLCRENCLWCTDSAFTARKQRSPPPYLFVFTIGVGSTHVSCQPYMAREFSSGT